MSHRRKEKDQRKAERLACQAKFENPNSRLRPLMRQAAKPGMCYFAEDVACPKDYECQSCENLPTELYETMLKRMDIRKRNFNPIKRPPIIQCTTCQKPIGMVYPAPAGAQLKEGGLGKDNMYYCKEHLSGGN